MTTKTRALTAGLLTGVMPFSLAWAQSAQDLPDEGALETPEDVVDEFSEADSDVIVVGGRRQRGATLSEIEPELTLTESDIEAYGVSTLGELLEVLSQETSSGRSRRGGGGGPVVLLNGRRISGFREIGRYPPEALARVEVLPEEAALSYGFSADQRVINFVLKPNVIVRAAEGEVEAPDQGGNAISEGSFQRLSVDGPRRLSIDFRYVGESPLLESERDFVQEASALPFASPGNLGANDFGDPIGALLGGDASFTTAALQDMSFTAPIVGGENPSDDRLLRTLRPERDEYSLGFSRAGDFLWESVLTLTGEIEHSESLRLLGQPEVALDLPASNPFVPFADGLTLYAAVPERGALRQNTESDTLSLGASIISKPGRTNWTFTASYEDVETDTLTQLGVDEAPLQLAVDGGADPFAVLSGQLDLRHLRNETRTRTASTNLVINAKTFELPAGDVTMTTQFGASTREQDVSTDLEGVVTDSALSRDTLSAQWNVDVPVLFAEEEGGFGDLSLNANVNVRDLSDFGTLTTLGGGFTWKPTERLRVIGSHTREEGAPSIGQLGDPTLETPNVRVFDFTSGETVLVTNVSGGNPDLVADSRDVSKLGVQYKPFEKQEVTFNVDYTQSFLQDEARGFPALTAEVEAAFADRFRRDADGNLLSIDRRPVNFDESRQRQIRTGINWSKQLSRGGRPGGRGGPPPGVSRGGGRGGPPPGVSRGSGSGGPPPGVTGQRPPSAGAPSGGRPPQASGAPQSGRPGGPPTADGQQAQQGQQRRQVNRQPTRSGRPGRRFISLFHTWVLEDTILIREGLPELDLLNGSAISDTGGVSAHRVELSYRRWNKGLGVFARTSWRSSTEVRGDLTGGDDLKFSDLAVSNIRLAYDLGYSGAVMQRAPWLRDTRVVFGVDNMFNARVEVRDGNGDIPVRFQPDLIDPLGRVFEIEIRKRF
ncbi:MAG: hypothetical protein HRU11_02620 [Parvularculaceae bacterium]|nr:hypothetical protein [Parvularculaceae bacterium]